MEPLGGSDAPIDGRLRLCALLVLFVFGVFALRLFQLQIIEGDALRQRSERNSVRIVRLEAPRGEVLDRRGRVLATTRPAWELQVVPEELRHPRRTLAALAQLLGEPLQALHAAVERPRGGRWFRPVTLAEDLDWSILARVETHRFALAGVSTHVRPRRFYPEGSLAAHVLGSIGEIRADQLAQERFAGYRPGDVIGQTGLEARFESHLRGRSGGRNVVVDATGREVEVLDQVAPVPGGRVVLALDEDLQRAAEAAFLDVPEGAPARRGALVALDPRNGDVLALVSEPGYNPNDFAEGIDAARWQALRDDPGQPLQNRAVQNHYPPGSTHKAIVAAALLAEGLITPETRTFCPGYFRYGGRTYRCWKRGGHGSVNLVEALKESCDVFFYTHGVELGIDRMARIARGFGLGQRTGIGLPGEASGLVPSREWKRERFGQPWFPGETVSASIGQGFNLYTPLQMAVAYAAIANGGKVLRPRLVLRLESWQGSLERTFPPQVVQRVPVSAENLAVVRRGLTAVVQEPGGTGRIVRLPGLRVAGKTGTAQVVSLERTQGLREDEIPLAQRDHAWFVAFAPAENAEIVVVAFVEHGRHGSSGAGPLVRKVLHRWLDARQQPQHTLAARGGSRALH